MKQKVVALLTAAVLAAGGGIVGGLDVQAAQWHQDGYGWWLQEDGGTGYAVNGWRQVDGSWYYFDGSGYMLTGWQNLGGTWYYMYDNGVMAANTWIGNYYLGASGGDGDEHMDRGLLCRRRRRVDPGDMEAVSGSGMDAAGGIAMRTAAIQRTAGNDRRSSGIILTRAGYDG